MTTVRIGASQPGDARRASSNANTRLGSKRPPGWQDYYDNYAPFGKMVLSLVNSDKKIVIPYAPREVQYSGFGRNWAELNRDGDRAPLLVPASKQLKKFSFSVILGRDFNLSIKNTLADLESLAKGGRPVIVQWSAHENGFWRITNFNVSSLLRHPDTNEISRATVDMEFTRASDASKNIGPANGGKKGNGKNNDGDKNKNGKDRPKKYTVKKGDTLQSIGMQFYKHHKAWRKIADFNQIKNPRAARELKAGKVLKLP